ncbi:MAG: hypothetical protein PHF25_00785 [Candidatus Margulisbacteria bacterium]|nr:hypothetical protein [Candidatus Margulisiibacteriota bacterium]
MPSVLLTNLFKRVDPWRPGSNMASNSPLVVIGQGDSKINFTVNVSADGGGNPFSGQTPAQQKSMLAELIFGANPKAVQLLEQLGEVLSALGITEVNVDKEGNLVGLKISLSKGNIEGLSKLDELMKDPKFANFLGQVFERFDKMPDVWNAKAVYTNNLKKILSSLTSDPSDISAKIIIAIMKMASEARSEVIKMIIEAMEKNHQLWMEVLKQMAEKAFEDKAEAKAFLEKLMSKIASGDVDAVKAAYAFLSSITDTPAIVISFASIEKIKQDFADNKSESVLDKFASKEKLDLMKPRINDTEFNAFISAVNEKNLSKAKQIIDASVTSGVKDFFQDIWLRGELGI